MKRNLILLAAATLQSLAASADDLAPAFPGAEGFARYTTTGGRGGEVRHVTNLNDSGTGSFRAAVNGSNKKIVVFDISGIINLQSDIKIGANTTIFGQTAPGEGITISGATTRYGGDNIIVRFVRFRRGNVPDEVSSKDGVDATWERQKSNIILDHCSISWGNDEVASFYDNNNFSMQWCTIGEAFNNISHSFAGIWGGKGATFHHNLIIHCNNRVPRFNGARYKWSGYDQTQFATTVLAERVDFRNCVIYNWGSGKCYGGNGGGFINIINNYYKAGPATNKNTAKIVTQCDGQSDLYSKYYIDGNYVEAAGSAAENYDWTGVKTDDGMSPAKNKTFTDPDNLYNEGAGKTHCVYLSEPIAVPDITTHSAKTAYEKVLTYAGASLAKDIVDARYERETRNGEAISAAGLSGPGILNYITEQPDYYLASQGETRPANWDTDNDGMPDHWEIANGLNPNDPSDAKTFTLDPRGYYTNIEVYANSLVEPLIKARNADAIDAVDEYFPQVVVAAVSTITIDPFDPFDPSQGGFDLSQSTHASGYRIEYYTLTGIRVAPSTPGILISRVTLPDGTTHHRKHLNP